MPNASASAHTLSQPWINNAGVALGILVLEFTVEHPRHNLHILMGMRAESHVWFNDVIIAHQEEPMMSILRIVMIAKAEAMIGIEPTDVGVKPLILPSSIDPLATL